MAGKIAGTGDDAIVASGSVVCVLDEQFTAYPGDLCCEFFNKNRVMSAAAWSGTVKTSIEEELIFGMVDEGLPLQGKDEVIIGLIQMQDSESVNTGVAGILFNHNSNYFLPLLKGITMGKSQVDHIMVEGQEDLPAGFSGHVRGGG